MQKKPEQGKVNVLIIDDVVSNLVLLSRIVSKLGYQARPVVSIPQAIKALDIGLPHIILLDVAMPEVSGFDFCNYLKSKEVYKQIPVVFVSAHDDLNYKLKAFELGAVDYIARPFSNEEFAARLKIHVRTTLKEQRLVRQNERLQKVIQSNIGNRKEEKLKVIRALYYMVKSQTEDQTYLERIGRYAKVFAMGLKLSPTYESQIDETFLETIEAVAPIHDLGMMVVDSNIIKKPGKLTMEEMSEVKQHTSYGIQPLSEMYNHDHENEYLKMAMDIAMYHHERYDGKGYPYGILNSSIPLAAKIVSVVSIFDSLTRETYYRHAYDWEQSVRIINAEAGKMFEPEMIQVFNRIQNQLAITYAKG